MRRLEAAGAHFEDQEFIFGSGARQAMVAVMLQELSEARLLAPRSHRLFSLPRQVRRNETGEQYWVNDLLYLVVKNRIVTICTLTSAQLDSLEDAERRVCPQTIIPLSTRDQLMESVHRVLDEVAPISRVRPSSRAASGSWRPQVLEMPVLVRRRVFKYPRWFLNRGSFNLLIVPPSSLIRDQSVEMVQRAARWIRRELCGNPPNIMWYDPTSDMMQMMIQKVRRTRCFPIPTEQLEGALENEGVTRSAYRLWKELFQGPVPTHGRLMVLATPSVAMSLMKLVMGSVPPELSVDLSRSEVVSSGARVIRITGAMSPTGLVQFEYAISSVS